MAKLKLTDWFDGSVKPVHVGVYQRDYGGMDNPRDYVFNYWDGERWGRWGDTPDEAEEYSRRVNGGVPQEPWRGLAEQPKEQKK